MASMGSSTPLLLLLLLMMIISRWPAHSDSLYLLLILLSVTAENHFTTHKQWCLLMWIWIHSRTWSKAFTLNFDIHLLLCRTISGKYDRSVYKGNTERAEFVLEVELHQEGRPHIVLFCGTLPWRCHTSFSSQRDSLERSGVLQTVQCM